MPRGLMTAEIMLLVPERMFLARPTSRRLACCDYPEEEEQMEMEEVSVELRPGAVTWLKEFTQNNPAVSYTINLHIGRLSATPNDQLVRQINELPGKSTKKHPAFYHALLHVALRRGLIS